MPISAAPTVVDPPLTVLGPDHVMALPPMAAVQALSDALSSGVDPERDGVRSRLETPHGQLLQMPAASQDYAGTKILTLTPGNTSRGRPGIQGVYVLFAGDTQQPAAVIDGAALTRIRTPAVSAFGLRLLGHRTIPRIVVFGAGVQAWEHIRVFHAVFGLQKVAVAARNPGAAAGLATKATEELGLEASSHGLAEAEALVGGADVTVCCTASPSPLFSGRSVRPGATVVATGSHQSGNRELDRELMARARICVESANTALAEAGEVIDAVAHGELNPQNLITLARLQQNGPPAPSTSRPAVFKTTGMPWQDLAIAAAIHRLWLSGNGSPALPPAEPN
ncbi:ornithine cyclodeaminase family protein [Arthrobacter globiformis]|uniref:ornithine cyclodeaminase family protein n=1 Tax=Arthrobacter globiformis TaxID=1665 RepID=UPI0027860487|nr:ornithine cyclodeaminase family protein [Arthrobacter globiformis]MDQ0864825.1 ornithine cyclodeaminase/alanine dehydrogenase-like protein (mu-crystallin family) [Arthrobacter globiformis]